MVKLIVLIIASVILLLIFIIILISAFIKKTKRLFILSAFSFLILFGTGIYTLYFGIKKGKEKTVSIAKNVIKSKFPPFDSNKPDTEANKKNFREFLKVDITPDIKNIYCFDDAIGQDSDFMFSFSCDSITANKIIERNRLKKDSLIGNNPESLQHDFFWWDKSRINELECYSWSSNYSKKNVHKLFWYDMKNKKAYFFEYDL